MNELYTHDQLNNFVTQHKVCIVCVVSDASREITIDSWLAPVSAKIACRLADSELFDDVKWTPLFKVYINGQHKENISGISNETRNRLLSYV